MISVLGFVFIYQTVLLNLKCTPKLGNADVKAFFMNLCALNDAFTSTGKSGGLEGT